MTRARGTRPVLPDSVVRRSTERAGSGSRFHGVGGYEASADGIVCHSCGLRPLGMPAADVLDLLENPPSPDVDGHLWGPDRIEDPIERWPEPGEELWLALRNSAVVWFRGDSERVAPALRRVLVDERYGFLVCFLAYIRTCFGPPVSSATTENQQRQEAHHDPQAATGRRRHRWARVAASGFTSASE